MHEWEITLSQTTSFRLSKLREFADDNLKFDKNGKKFSKRVENTKEKEKLLVTNNFSFSHSVFKRVILQTRKNQGLLRKDQGSIHVVKWHCLEFQ